MGYSGVNLNGYMLLSWFVTAALVLSTGEAMCPNRCNRHGDCDPYGRCVCWDTWDGADCSERICPSSIAWSDEATATDVAHVSAQCSNRGKCNRKTGRCQCMEGFSGAACERSTCPHQCSGHGTCRSMEDFAEDFRDDNSNQYLYTNVWDSNKLHRCVCDTGYHGYDCSLRMCPTGDDPLTTGQVNEIQLIVCEASGGTFVLYYEGHGSSSIPYDASAEDIEEALEDIQLVNDVNVVFSSPSSGACNSTYINVIQVEFTQTFGSLRPMWSYNGLISGDVATLAITADGSTVYDSENVGYSSVKGTKENEECSNRGLCDSSQGVCRCYTTNDDIFAASDGYNGPGTRGDCGYAVTTTAGCPGEIACSGHGTCNEIDFSCDCHDGWTTGDCSLLTCPYGWSWFSYPSTTDKAHSKRAECSDGGVCNRETGRCECGNLFHGAACEYMICPGGIEDACHGHGRYPLGFPSPAAIVPWFDEVLNSKMNASHVTSPSPVHRCMSMAELALSAEDNGDATDFTYGEDLNKGSTWDAHRIFGQVLRCSCDDGYTGYDCTEQVCPSGDDPGTWDQKQEVQLIRCQATNGTFTLMFRQAKTEAISADSTSTELEAALVSLSTLDVVTITFNNDNSVCTTNGTAVAMVTFVTEHGDVPPLTADTTNLVHDDFGGGPGSGNITIAADSNTTLGGLSPTTGTTEEMYCSNRGLCARDTGECSCFRGWASSNGAGEIGDRADCGYRVPMATRLRGSLGGRESSGEYKHLGMGVTEAERYGRNRQGNKYRDMTQVDIAEKV
ncbi:unnamed protein product [Discosporangium mesarthrocarpum]